MEHRATYVPDLRSIPLSSVDKEKQIPGYIIADMGKVIDISSIFNNLAYCKLPKSEQCKRCVARENCPELVH